MSPVIDPEHRALYLTIEKHVFVCVHARARRRGVNYLQTATIYQLRAQTPAPDSSITSGALTARALAQPLCLLRPFMHVRNALVLRHFGRAEMRFSGDSINPRSSHRLADNLSDSSEGGVASEGIKPLWRSETSCWSASIGGDVCSRRVTSQLHS